MTPEMVVSGAPIKKGGWSPHNYDGSLSHPNVPMKVALAKSYNIAAVHLLEQVGIQAGGQMVRRFGITNPMAPSLPSALGASEASLLEMTAAYSAFPNKGVRVAPHLIRKVYSRDGSLLEEFDNSSSKVTSEYVALTMVQMMRGVVAGGGTATNASASGHPLAGKTGTVNDHTDVWFIGYTPKYVTGIWMGNPLRKENLGNSMTGGHGAVPFFNAFMIPFMKDKPKDTFEAPPPMPSDIRRESERRKREELETLAEAEQNAKKTGLPFTPDPELAKDPALMPPDPVGGDRPAGGDRRTERPDGPPENQGAPKRPPVQAPPTRNDSPPNDKPEGTRRKGKKGDG
jgi:penicillin-binding protein 1A